MTKYVLSTMTNGVNYAFWSEVKKGQDVPVMRDKIFIHGGAGLPSLKSGVGEMTKDGEGIPMWTPAGVVTPISDERYDKLKDHPLFKKHLEGGFVKVVNQDITGNHKAIVREVASMEKNDGFAQLNAKTIKDHVRAIKISTDSIDSDIQFRQ